MLKHVNHEADETIMAVLDAESDLAKNPAYGESPSRECEHHHLGYDVLLPLLAHPGLSFPSSLMLSCLRI